MHDDCVSEISCIDSPSCYVPCPEKKIQFATQIQVMKNSCIPQSALLMEEVTVIETLYSWSCCLGTLISY